MVNTEHLSRGQFGVSTHVLRGLDPENHFRLLARHNFRIVELSLNYFTILEDCLGVKALQQMSAGNNIRINSFHFPYGLTVPALGCMDISDPSPEVRNHTIDVVRLCLERIMPLNLQCLVLHPSTGQIKDNNERRERISFCLESLRRCLKILENYQLKYPPARTIKIAIETLYEPGLFCKTADILFFFNCLNNNPPLGLCLDINHANLRQNLVRFIHDIGCRVITTHLSDNDGLKEKHWLPGKGVIPWKDTYNAFLASGYRGPFIYETSPEPGVPDDEMLTKINRHSMELTETDQNRF